MKPLFRLLLSTSLLLGSTAALAGALDTPVGTWKQVDDVSGKAKSIIQISETSDGLQAKVLQLMNRTPEEIARSGDPALCKKCDGPRKDQPIVGMTIMWGVTKDGKVWDGGKILDPKSGKIYKVKLSLVDGGRLLDVHGYIGFALLGRSQTWERQP